MQRRTRMQRNGILLPILLAAVQTILGWLSHASNVEEIFTDVTAQAGIVWRHDNGESDDRFLIEATCGGVGFLDYDSDGLLDIYLVNGGRTPKGNSQEPIGNALYRNLGNGRFDAATTKAGVAQTDFFGMGVAAADYDNDGFQDLFVTGYPACALFHNNRNGTFSDITEQAGVRNQGKWAAGAAWFDYNRDGLLDLFVCNYAEFSFQDAKRCRVAGFPAYCEQKAYPGQVPKLFRNNGNATFSDMSAASGIESYSGRALGVVAIDADDDGWTDLFLARDASPNLLLINRRDGTFEDRGVEAEVAYSPEGLAKAGMGVDAGDVNDDGRPDFVVTNFNDEYHSILLSGSGLLYGDGTIASGMAALTRAYVGWGVRFVDYDSDGDLDLLIANGHINRVIELTRRDVTYEQPLLLLENNGRGVFKNLKQSPGPVFQARHASRGMATGDFDNDGDPDAIFIRLGSKPVLLRNNVGQAGSWIGFELQGVRSNRDAIGARLALEAAGQKRVRWVTSGASFLASHDKRVLFGLGREPVTLLVDVEIRWPSGTVQRLAKLGINRYHRAMEPSGQ